MLYPGLLSLFLLSCAGKTITAPAPPERYVAEIEQSPVKEAWEAKWEQVLREAKKEGKVVMYTSTGGPVTKAWVDNFTKKHGLSLEIVSGRGGELSSKILTERRNGLYLVDVMVTGSSTFLQRLKPAGAFEPIEQALLLPEVKDPEVWWEKRLPFLDNDRRLIITYNTNISGDYLLINMDFMQKGEVDSYFDLLNPKFKGKIVIQDPTTSGKGLKWFSSVLHFGWMDLSFMKDLVKQAPVLTRDERQQVEWVARGKHLIGVATAPEPILEFQKAGVPLVEMNPREHKPTLTSTGSGNVALINRAPHPHAAGIFINWLLSHEGQTIYSLASENQSARLDVPTEHLPKKKIRDTAIKYVRTDTEEYTRLEEDYKKLAEKIFASVLSK